MLLLGRFILKSSMSRRGRHKKLFKFRLKKGNLQSLTAIFLFFVSGLSLIAYFFPTAYINSIVKAKLIFYFGGVGAPLFPLLVLLLGLIIFDKIRSEFIQIRVFFGIFLGSVSILVFSTLIGRDGGLAGKFVSENLREAVSTPGAFLTTFTFLIASFLITFNTNLDSFVDFLVTLLTPIKKIPEIFSSFGKLFSKKDSSSEEVVVGESVQKTEGNGAPTFQIIASPSEPVSAEANKTGKEIREEALREDTVTNMPYSDQVWEYPSIDLLSDIQGPPANRGDVKKNASIIEKTLDSFGVKAKVVEVNMGPAVTQYALESAQGTKITKITNLQSDLAMALASPTGSVRIEAPIPGKSLIGVEVPNFSPALVTIKSVMTSEQMRKMKSKLTVALGLDVSGTPWVVDIAKMPHILVAGATGSGKSILLHSFMTSLLFRASPAECKFILIDPKRVELPLYNDIPHLLTPVIVDPMKALPSLKWALAEMTRRYRLFENAKVRDIDGYNEMSGFQALPYIVIMVDELADLMSAAAVEVEKTVCRLAQMSRATGIHLVLATQRPSVDVITGLIKANIPCRIAFNVVSQVDSRVIIDQAGAEKLLGRGDMFFVPPESSRPIRLQGAFVSEKERMGLVEFLKKSSIKPDYKEEVTELSPAEGGKPMGSKSNDPLFDQAVEIICQYDRASSSLLQRRLQIGYARAARLLDELEARGIVSPADGSKPRSVKKPS